MDGLLLSGSLSAEITAKTVEVIQRNAQAQSALVDDTSLDGIHVLVVDDQSDARILLEVVFQQCNARVSNAASSAEALQLISNFCPDVVISDIGNRTLKSLVPVSISTPRNLSIRLNSSRSSHERCGGSVRPPLTAIGSVTTRPPARSDGIQCGTQYRSRRPPPPKFFFSIGRASV